MEERERAVEWKEMAIDGKARVLWLGEEGAFNRVVGRERAVEGREGAAEEREGQLREGRGQLRRGRGS